MTEQNHTMGVSGAARIPLISRMAAVALAVILSGSVGVAAASPTSDSSLRPSPRMVTLVTGDRVLVGSTGTTSTLRIIRAVSHGPGSQLTTMSFNGDQYVIPASAQPYLGRYLDPHLFDVTRLAADTTSGRLGLHISYRGTIPPSIPGITITSAAAGEAEGYATRASARLFGAALARQAVIDARAGWPASDALFRSVSAIALDGTVVASTVPNFPQVTLSIHMLEPSGRAAPFGFGFLMNADDAAKYGAFVFVVHGVARVSVPLGHYMGLFDEETFTRSGHVVARVLPISDYEVAKDGQTLTVDGARATREPSVRTPKPSTPQILDVTIDESDAKGDGGLEASYEVSPPDSELRLAPTHAPSVGELSQTTRWLLVDPKTLGERYAFDATFKSEGIPVRQANSIPGVAHLATIHERYAADRRHRVGGVARFVLSPDQFFASAEYLPVPMPSQRTEYVLVPKGSVIQDSVLSDFLSWDPGIFDGDIQSAAPGSVRSDTWLRHPFTLAVPAHSTADRFPICLACRSATAMTLVLLPNDGAPTHAGEVFSSPDGSPVAHFAVYRDGSLLLDRKDSLGGAFKVPKGPGDFRVIADLDRSFTRSRLSTSIQTVLTFSSSPTSGTPLPASWGCYTGEKCRVLPILRAHVNLNATPWGDVAEGASVFDISVGHVQGSGNSSIRAVTVSVRPTGSSGWRSLPVTFSMKGLYQARFTAGTSLAGQLMDIRVTASDADGGTISQTTTSAFFVQR